MWLRMLYNMKKYMFFQKLVPKNSLYLETGCEDGDKQLRNVSVRNLTTAFKFHGTPIKSLCSQIMRKGSPAHSFKVKSGKLLASDQGKPSQRSGLLAWRPPHNISWGMANLERGCFISHLLKCLSQLSVVRENETAVIPNSW